MKRIMFALLMTGAFVGPALADDDGSTTECIFLGCWTEDINVAPNSIDRNELSTDVRNELDGLQNNKADKSDLDTVESESIARDNVQDDRLSTAEGDIDRIQRTNIRQMHRLNNHDRRINQNTSDIDGLEAENGEQWSAIQESSEDIDQIQRTNIRQMRRLNEHDRDISSLENENDRQQRQINTNNAVNWHQKRRLDDHDDAIGSLEDHNLVQDAAINANSSALMEHSKTLASHSRRLDDQEKGIAISIAMPDAYLNPLEKFAVAAGFGGYEGETAFGAIGAVRIDQTFSLYAGGGMSTDGDQFGWKAGARAGW